MNFRQAQTDAYIKNPDKNIKAILLYGQNEGLINEQMKKLIKTVAQDIYDPFCVAYLNFDDVKSDFGMLAGEYNSQSLMGERRVIILKDADNSLAKDINVMLEGSVSNNLLLICGTHNLNSKSALVNNFTNDKSLAAIACYEDREADVALSTRKYLIEKAITFDNEAFSLLCSRLSNDRQFNINEIEKLITYVGSKKHFNSEDVKAVVFDQAVSGIDDLCFYTFGNEKMKAMNSLKYLRNEGTEEVQIIRAFIRHLTKLLEGKALVEAGNSPSEAIKKVLPRNMFFRYEMGATQLKIWPKERLLDVAELLYKAERDCKTTDMPNPEILSYMILTLLSASGKLMRRG